MDDYDDGFYDSSCECYGYDHDELDFDLPEPVPPKPYTGPPRVLEQHFVRVTDSADHTFAFPAYRWKYTGDAGHVLGRI